MPGLILAIMLMFQSQTVAVTLAPDTPAIIMSRSDAEIKFKQLCADGSDDKLLRALAAALNPMPNWPQMVMNGDASVCNRNPKPLMRKALPKGRERTLQEQRRWRRKALQQSGVQK